MKRLFIAAVLSLVIASAFANDNSKVSSYVSNCLKADFPGTVDVQWTMMSEFAKADFIYAGKKTQAFYTTAGKLVGVGQSLSLNDIPAKATKKIQQRYTDYAVSEVISFQHDEQALLYYVSVENASKKIILEVTGDGAVSVFKASAK